MAITFVASGAVTTGNNASVTPGAITGVAVDDLVLIQAAIRNTPTGSVVTPTGWTQVAVQGGHVLLGRFWQTGDALPLVTFSGGVANADTMARGHAFRGAGKDALVSAAVAAQANVSAANIAYPGLDVPGPAQAAVLALWKADDASAYTTPGGYTATSLVSTTTGDDASMRLLYFIQAEPGSAYTATSGTITVTGGAAAISSALMLAVKAAAVFSAILQDEYPSRVLLTVSGLSIGDSVEFFRVVAGQRTAVRAGATDSATDQAFLRVDAELPFGVPVSYVAVVNDTAEYTTSPVTYDLPGGKVAVSDAISGEAAEVVILSWPEKAYDADGSLFRAGGRNVVVSNGFGQATGTIELVTEADSSADNVRALLASATGGIIQIRQPGGYVDVDSYQAVTDYRVRRWSQDGSDPRRVFSLNVAEVDGWAPELEARGYTYQDLEDLYAGLDYADLQSDYDTYLDLAQADLAP